MLRRAMVVVALLAVVALTVPAWAGDCGGCAIHHSAVCCPGNCSGTCHRQADPPHPAEIISSLGGRSRNSRRCGGRS